MRFLGAKVIVTPAAERAVGMVKKTIDLAKANGWFMTRQFENEANPDFHSRTTAREIIDDFAGDRLDFWVTGYGTGGTLKGVGRVLRKERPETKIIVCEPACPNEYRDYLASLHIRAFDFICHPYRKTDLERILQATLSERAHAARLRGAMVDTVSVLETRAGLH